MTKKTIRQNDPAVYAVLHRTGQVWRGLIVRNGTGRDSHARPTIVAFREFGPGMDGRIESWLDEHSAAELLCVLPASSIICRTCPLPDASPEHLDAALRLQAEAHLIGIAPQHRLGMAVLEQSTGETTRSGIILAWPESAAVDLPQTSRPVTCTPDIAAVAAIIDGQRPTQPVLWLDRGSGSVALALSHAGGVAFRCLREDDDDSQTWRASVSRAIVETGLNAGHTPEFIQGVVHRTEESLAEIGPDGYALLAPVELIEHSAARLSGVNNDAQWWSQYGIAAGAVLVRSGPLASLARMREQEPTETPSLISSVIDTLSSPRTAIQLAAVCVLGLMFGPLAMNWARLKVLEFRYSDIDSKMKLVNDVRNHLVVYRELGNSAWPMTKVLSDIVCNTPEGVELESIRLNPGIVVRGRALPHGGRSATEVVVLMQENLRNTGMFTDVTVSWGDSDAYGNFDFDISARLLHPFRRFSYPEELDFGRTTLAERLYGTQAVASADNDQVDDPSAVSPDEASSDAPQLASTGLDDPSSQSPDGEDPYAELHNPRSESRVDRPIHRPSSSSIGGEASTREAVRGQSGVPLSQDIPAPMTEAQIRAMSDAEVMDMLIRVGHARQAAKARNDDELYQRLQREFNWLMARRRGDL